MSTVETGAGSLGEALLYRLARALYNTEIAHTEDMKASLSDMDSYDAFRASESVKMINQLNALGISYAVFCLKKKKNKSNSSFVLLILAVEQFKETSG